MKHKQKCTFHNFINQDNVPYFRYQKFIFLIRVTIRQVCSHQEKIFIFISHIASETHTAYTKNQIDMSKNKDVSSIYMQNSHPCYRLIRVTVFSRKYEFYIQIRTCMKEELFLMAKLSKYVSYVMKLYPNNVSNEQKCQIFNLTRLYPKYSKRTNLKEMQHIYSIIIKMFLLHALQPFTFLYLLLCKTVC